MRFHLRQLVLAALCLPGRPALPLLLMTAGRPKSARRLERPAQRHRAASTEWDCRAAT